MPRTKKSRRNRKTRTNKRRGGAMPMHQFNYIPPQNNNPQPKKSWTSYLPSVRLPSMFGKKTPSVPELISQLNDLKKSATDSIIIKSCDLGLLLISVIIENDIIDLLYIVKQIIEDIKKMNKLDESDKKILYGNSIYYKALYIENNLTNNISELHTIYDPSSRNFY